MRTKACGWLIAVALLLWTAVAMAQTQPAEPGTTTADKTVHERITTIRETETRVVERRQDENRVRTAAVFVKNRAKGVDDDKVAVLEDFITSRLTDKGFKIIAREDVLNAVSSFADGGPNQGDPTLPGADLDSILSNNTSALRLAQNLGADYILVASITTYGNDTIEYNDNNIHTLINESKMTVSYKLLDATAGGSMTGGVVEATKKDRAQPGLTIKRDMVNSLLNDTSAKLVDAMGVKVAEGRVAAVEPKPGEVQFNVVCSMGDLTVPEVMKTEAGEYIVTANRYTIETMNVTVAVDGITIGTTPGPFQSMPGLHKIRLSRDGFKDWEQTINIRQDLKLNVAMQMSDAGFDRWRETAAFLQGLKTNAKLTDAEVKVLEGYAKMLSQSDFHITTQNLIVDHHDDSHQNQNTNINIVR